MKYVSTLLHADLYNLRFALQPCTLFDAFINFFSSGWIQVFGCVKTTKIIFQYALKSFRVGLPVTTENLELDFMEFA